MANRGRPVSDNPRSEKIDIRLTVEERARLEAYAEEKNLSKTQVLVMAFEELMKKEARRKK